MLSFQPQNKNPKNTIHMKQYIFSISTVVLMAFVATTPHKNAAQFEADNTVVKDTIDNEYANYFVVVADTSADYFLLHKKMLALNRRLHIPIDTMGRFYNKAKNLIALPDNDADEVFAGNYFARRILSEDLSLEYLNFYQPQSREKTIALVTGIYETQKSADSALAVLKKAEKKAFKIASTIYIGCMH